MFFKIEFISSSFIGISIYRGRGVGVYNKIIINPNFIDVQWNRMYMSLCYR